MTNMNYELMYDDIKSILEFKHSTSDQDSKCIPEGKFVTDIDNLLTTKYSYTIVMCTFQ